MADDLDDLLDEVESKFVKDQGPRTFRKSTSSAASDARRMDSNPNKVSIESCEIDELLQEEPKFPKLTAPRTSLPSISGLAQTCYPVFIAGSNVVCGYSSGDNPRACSKLRCLDCDFLVSIFDNFKWDPSIDYLFLRNNMPDFNRLKSKLVPSSGARAYACQCQSRSVDSLVRLDADTKLKWVCSRH